MLNAPLLDENYSVNQPIKNEQNKQNEQNEQNKQNEQNEQNEKNQQQLYNTSNYESNWCSVVLINSFFCC